MGFPVARLQSRRIQAAAFGGKWLRTSKLKLRRRQLAFHSAQSQMARPKSHQASQLPHRATPRYIRASAHHSSRKPLPIKIFLPHIRHILRSLPQIQSP